LCYESAMGQATEDMADTASEKKAGEVLSLNDRIAAILTEIERETVPARLLELAAALQQALVLERQRSRPN
jgi:hypothetical protein